MTVCSNCSIEVYIILYMYTVFIMNYIVILKLENKGCNARADASGGRGNLKCNRML